MTLTTPLSRRMAREHRAMALMVALYCRNHHHHPRLCPECAELERYAHDRLNRCRFQDQKSTCSACLVHCYAPAMRARMRAVMRYAGPRMLYRHPLLARRHLIDGRTGAR